MFLHLSIYKNLLKQYNMPSRNLCSSSQSRLKDHLYQIDIGTCYWTSEQSTTSYEKIKSLLYHFKSSLKTHLFTIAFDWYLGYCLLNVLLSYFWKKALRHFNGSQYKNMILVLLLCFERQVKNRCFIVLDNFQNGHIVWERCHPRNFGKILSDVAFI